MSNPEPNREQMREELAQQTSTLRQEVAELRKLIDGEIIRGTVQVLEEQPAPPAPPARDPLMERMAAMPLPDAATNPMVLLRDHGAHPYAFELAKRFATVLEQGGMLPKSYTDKRDRDEARAAALVAIMHGARVGLEPLAAVQGLAVVNGMPKLWGDALPAVVLQHGVRIQEDLPRDWNEESVAVCTVTRPGFEPVTREFSYADAKRAGLLNKESPWKTYPKRMLQMRARALAIRDLCPDLLSGIGIAEEALDEEPLQVQVQARTMETPKIAAPASRPTQADVQAAVLRETTPAGRPSASEPPQEVAKPEVADDDAPPRIEERSQLGGGIVGRMVALGVPLEHAQRAARSELVRDDGEIRTTKSSPPRNAELGDVWICEKDAKLRGLREIDNGARVWEALDLSPPAPHQEPEDQAEEPLVDPKELDPDVPGGDSSWRPELPASNWADCHASETPDEDLGDEVVWISTKPGRTKGVAYATRDGAWRPDGAAGSWARAFMVDNWSGTEGELQEQVGDWRTCELDALYDAVLGMGGR